MAQEVNQTHVMDWLNQKKVSLAMQSLGNLSIFSGEQSSNVSVSDQTALFNNNQNINNTILELTQNLVKQMKLN